MKVGGAWCMLIQNVGRDSLDEAVPCLCCNSHTCQPSDILNRANFIAVPNLVHCFQAFLVNRFPFPLGQDLFVNPYLGIEEEVGGLVLRVAGIEGLEVN